MLGNHCLHMHKEQKVSTNSHSVFIESLEYARHFQMLITFNPHNHLVREVSLVLF